MAKNFWVFHNGIFSRLVFILPKQTKVLFSCSYYFLRGVYHNCKKQTSALKVNVNFLCIVIIHSEIFSRANKKYIYRESTIYRKNCFLYFPAVGRSGAISWSMFWVWKLYKQKKSKEKSTVCRYRLLSISSS